MKTMRVVPVSMRAFLLTAVLVCWITTPAWSQVQVSQWDGSAKLPTLRLSSFAAECSIFAEVEGDQDPGESNGGSLTNGPFTITTRSGQQPLGDGVDEDTQWSFTQWKWSDEPDKDFDRPFNSMGSLQKALVTLGISTKGGQVNTDWVEIDEDDFDNLEEVQGLPGNTTIQFEIDLLDYPGDGYTSDAIIDLLVSNNGAIPMLYSDDAVIFYAKLELTFNQGCPCITPEEIRWNNPGGGPFSTDGNWLDLEVPGEEQTALFDVGGAYTVTFGDSPNNNNLIVTNDGVVTMDLAFNTYNLSGVCGPPAVEIKSDGGTLIVKNGDVNARHDVLVHEGVNPELIVTTDGSFQVLGSHNLTVGSASGIASVTVEQGGFLDNDGTTTLGGERGSRGDAFVMGAGSDFLAAELIVGDEGTATLKISDQGSVAADDMTFVKERQANGSTLEVSDKGTLAVDRLEVASGRSTQAEVVLKDQGTLLEVGDHLRLGNRGEATLRLEGMAALKEVGGAQGEVVAGFGTDSKGMLELEDDGTLLDITRVVIGHTGEGFMTVKDDAEALMDELLIGRRQPGMVTLQNGGELSTTTLQMGLEQGGTAQLTITGSSNNGPSALEILGRAEVGLEDAATLNMDGGAAIYGDAGTGDLILGAGATGTGTLELDGLNTSISDLNQVVVGGQLTGTMKVTGQAEVSDVNAVVLGQSNSNAQGMLEVGPGRVTPKTLTVGDQGGGTVLIKSGGTVQVEDGLTLGGASAATGTITVTGIGAELSASGNNVQTFKVGDQGTGTLVVMSGADLIGSNTTTISLGHSQGGSGTMQVLENATLATNFRRIAVGEEGSGNLTVSNQGTLDTQFLWIPRGRGMGTTTVFGQGSSITAQRIFVGQQGQGTLTVDGNGTVTANQVRLGAQGSFFHQNGILNVGQIITPTAQGKIAEAGLTTDTLFVEAGATLEVDSVAFNPGGVLGGSYAWTYDLTNEGTITPGDSAGVAGTFTVDADYVQGAGGVLHIELGAAHDVLDVSGAATLGETLRLSVLPGEEVSAGQVFEIVRAGSVEGAFAQVEIDGRFDVEVSYTATTVEVMVVTAVVAEQTPGAEGSVDEVPTDYLLSQNYPNPFNPSTTIAYALPEAGSVRLVVYDLHGREVTRLVDRMQGAGRYTVRFEARDLASGVYFYRLEAGPFMEVKQLLLLK